MTIRELKGTASLIPTVDEALIQDTAIVKAAASRLVGNIRESYAGMVNDLAKLKAGDMSVIASIEKAGQEISRHLDGKAAYYPLALCGAFSRGGEFSKYDIKVPIHVIVGNMSLILLYGKVSDKIAKSLDDAMKRLETSLAALDIISNYNGDMLFREIMGDVLLDLTAMLDVATAEAERLGTGIVAEAEAIFYLKSAI